MRKSIITAQCFLFVLVMLIWVTATADTNPGYVVRACDLMDEPYRDAKAVAALEEGTDVEILKRKGGWLNITVGDHTGWVRMSKIRKGEAAAKPGDESPADKPHIRSRRKASSAAKKKKPALKLVTT